MRALLILLSLSISGTALAEGPPCKYTDESRSFVLCEAPTFARLKDDLVQAELDAATCRAAADADATNAEAYALDLRVKLAECGKQQAYWRGIATATQPQPAPNSAAWAYALGTSGTAAVAAGLYLLTDDGAPKGLAAGLLIGGLVADALGLYIAW